MSRRTRYDRDRERAAESAAAEDVQAAPAFPPVVDEPVSPREVAEDASSEEPPVRAEASAAVDATEETTALAQVPLEPEEDLSDLPEALQGAILCFRLKRADVLDHRVTEDGVVIVTRGGRKLRWPGDEDRATSLTPEEKDGVPRRDFPPANLFGRRS
jgi:hypothetical protein